MITDVRLLLASPTPTGDHRLVVQRQFEQLAGPVIQLFSVRNPPSLSRDSKDSRPCVVMWLADSSGMHVGRKAAWPALELRAAEAGGGTWNLARQLGRSHWDADTVLHLELREQARDELHRPRDELLASFAVPPPTCSRGNTHTHTYTHTHTHTRAPASVATCRPANWCVHDHDHDHDRRCRCAPWASGTHPSSWGR